MKTLICNAPGEFEYREGHRPGLTKDRAILKIIKVGICGTDLHAFEGTQPYFSYPRILGHEIAAELVDIDGKSEFSPYESVTVIPYFNCGQCVACRTGNTNCCEKLLVAGVHMDGAMVEYLSVPSNALVHGSGLPTDCLAVIEPLAIGAHAVRRGCVKPGEYALVIGAGPIGLGIMAFAKISGATVIAVDTNINRLSFCRQNLKVPYAISADSHNVEATLRDITHGDMPGIIFDATGNLAALNNAFRYMAHAGRYILVGLQKGNISFSHPEFHKREGTVMSSRNATRRDFDQVISAIKTGQLNPLPWITHRVPFDHLKTEFPRLLDPDNGVIKAMVEMPWLASKGSL